MTRLAGWIRTGQCDRYLQWSARWRTPAASSLRAQRGTQHERLVLAALSEEQAVRPAAGADIAALLAERIREGGGILTGATLRREGLVGVPDLILVQVEGGRVSLVPGDIKSSPTARDEQKWQVALYAWLLAPIAADLGAEIADGLLLIRPLGSPLGEHAPVWFSLAPWQRLVPRLLARTRTLLPGTDGSWRLGGACAGCGFLSRCVPEALQGRSVRLIPDLSAGVLQRLERAGVANIDAAAALPEGADWGRLPGHAEALCRHHVVARPIPERHLPAPGAPVAVATSEEDPDTGELRALVLAAAGGAAVRWTTGDALSLPDGAWLLHYGGRIPRLLALLDLAPPEDPHTARPRMVDLRALLLSDFRLPVVGAASLWQVGRLLGLSPALSPPESLLHARGEEPPEDRLAVMAALWRWMAPQLSPAAGIAGPAPEGGPMLRGLLSFLHRQRALACEQVRRLQALPLPERVERYAALGPLTVTGRFLDEEGRLLHRLKADCDVQTTRLRVGDFLRLAAVGLADLQAGVPVILERIEPAIGELAVALRQRRALSDHQTYSLEADLTDFNHPRLLSISQEVLSDPAHPLTRALFQAAPRLPAQEEQWAEGWLAVHPELQARQVAAFRLAFQHHIAVIEGPPGTGKTWLLTRILGAVLQRAAETGAQLHIGITALTHKAIDQLLRRLAAHLAAVGLEVPVAKIGRECEGIPGFRRGAALEGPLHIVGGTVYGLNRVFSARPGFDLIAVDEASQLLLPQAWLALVCGGDPRILLVGDPHQLGPVVRGPADDAVRSVLSHMLQHQASVRLNCSFRLSDGLCDFPSRSWYGGDLYPANPAQRLSLALPDGWPGAVLDPAHPTTLLVVEHTGSQQHAAAEADAVVALVGGLVAGGVATEDIAVLSPHRAQNSLIRARLQDAGVAPLPVVDTVERLQGAERDVVLLSLIASDPDQLDSEHLLDPRRFNVAITRARFKLVVVASRALLEAIPRSEAALLGGQHLARFVAHCQERGAVVHLERPLSGEP